VDTPKFKGCFESPLACFSRLQKAQTEPLSREEFAAFLASLFTDWEDADPSLDKEGVAERLFKAFDRNQDGKLDFSEFEAMWGQWVVQMLQPKSAFVVVDVQNDFISGTLSLKNIPAGQDPECIIPVINELTEQLPFDVVVYTFDWHPRDHISFFENKHCRVFHPSSKVSVQDARTLDTVVFIDRRSESGCIEQTLWPSHCVQDSWGAELHKDLRLADGALKIYKGINPDVDSYSAFWDNARSSETSLHRELRNRGVTTVFVCGLAYDVCVGFTALHALELGYGTILVGNACCGTSAEAVERMKSKLQDRLCLIVDSLEVADLVSGKRRPWQLGLQLATASTL
ncbi:unnamed protein product, partial [Ixodes hexagonus]